MKLISKFALVLSFALALPMSAQALTFSDVASGAWYAPYVNAVADDGVINGYEDGTFRPSNNITVAEMTTMLSNFWGVSDEVTVAADDHWAEASIQNAVIQGWLDEVPADYNAIMNRGEVADMVYVAMGLEPSSTSYFTDTTAESVNALYEKGIVNGKTETTFAPDDDITRAEISAILTRVMGKEIEVEEVVEDEVEEVVDATFDYGFVYPTITLDGSGDSFAEIVKAYVIAATSSEESVAVKVYKSDLGSQTLKEYVGDAFDWFCGEFAEFNATDSTSASTNFGWSESSDYYTLYLYVNPTYVERNLEAMAMADGLVKYFFEAGVLTSDMSQYEMAKAMYIWCAQDFTYDTSYGAIGRDAYGMLKNKTGVCSGYTGAYNMLCQVVGIKTLGVGSDSHLWSVLYLDGNWTYVDLTFGDPVGSAAGYYNIGYFDMTYDEIADWGDHEFPENYNPANSIKYNNFGIEY